VCKVSPSRSHVLVGYSPHKVYRHSIVATYAIFDTTTRYKHRTHALTT
jgi:hypothetical protein